MTGMLGGLLAGVALGAGSFLVVLGVRPPRPRLDVALTGLAPPFAGRLAPRHDGPRAFSPTASERQQDLAITGSSPERHAAERLATAWVFALLPIATAAVSAVGGVATPWTLAALGAAVGGALGFAVPGLVLRTTANERRQEFRRALSGYLDLVVVVVAGGGGIETALHDAADAGDGWVFTELRRSLEASRLGGVAPWDGFARLGSDLGVDELVELAAGASLAGEHGARVRASLAAKAASMRAHLLAEAEAEAQSATEKMAIPVVLMLFGFLTFVGYPAVDRVLTGL